MDRGSKSYLMACSSMFFVVRAGFVLLVQTYTIILPSASPTPQTATKRHERPQKLSLPAQTATNSPHFFIHLWCEHFAMQQERLVCISGQPSLAHRLCIQISRDAPCGETPCNVPDSLSATCGSAPMPTLLLPPAQVRQCTALFLPSHTQYWVAARPAWYPRSE